MRVLFDCPLSVAILAAALTAQEKVISLEPITAGAVRVRPMTATRAAIQPNHGAVLFLNSPQQIEVAILDPTNRRITEANAAGTGLSIQTQPAESSGLVHLTGEGFLTTVVFPAVVTPGNWRLEVTSTQTSEFEARYLIQDDAPIRFQLFSKFDSFESDRDAVVSGAVFDGGNPISGAQVSVEMDCRREVSALLEQVSWRPISSVLEGEERIFRTVLQIKSNAVANLNDLTLVLSPQAVGYKAEPEAFSIGSLAPGGTWTSPEFEVRQPRGTFLPAFQLQFEARGQRQTLAMLDSGDRESDAQTGDGLYGVKIRPSNPGVCSFLGTATGTSAGGAFQRSAYQRVPVNAVRGNIGTASDYSEDANGDGKPEVVGMTVQVNVRSAGTYRLEALFEKANKYADLSSTQDLAAGQNTIRLQMTADQLRVELGETGPFRRTDLRLSMVTNSGVEFVDKRESAGASAAWTLGGQGFSVRLGGTATLTAAPLPLPATGYKELSFSIPVTVTKPGECTWQVIVGQRNGDFKQTFDDYLSVGGSMPFSTILRGSIPGWKIRRQQAGGVFEIQFASVNCGGPMERWTGEGLARSEAYRAADFENPVPSFEIAPQSTNPGRLVMPRALLLTSEFFFEVEAIAGFENNLSCTVSPNRPGITAVFDRMPARPIDWPIKILVTVNAQAEVGPNPLTVSCEGRGVTKSAVLNLTVN